MLLLRLLFVVIFLGMAWATVRASLEQALFAIPPEVYTNPWFHATLLDAYLAFLTFYVWVAWREQSTAARILWLIAILLWGNFAMATYMLVALAAVPRVADLGQVFGTRRPGHLGLPAGFVVAGVAVYLLGARPLFA